MLRAFSLALLIIFHLPSNQKATASEVVSAKPLEMARAYTKMRKTFRTTVKAPRAHSYYRPRTTVSYKPREYLCHSFKVKDSWGNDKEVKRCR